MNINSLNKHWAILLVFALVGLVACGDVEEDEPTGENNPVEEGIEISGTWENQFEGVETITDESWDMGYLVQSIAVYDNAERFAVTQNPADAEYDPGKYNTVVWTPITSDSFHYCTVAFGLETVDDALNAEHSADATDLDGEGCGGFPWSKLTRQ